MKTFTSTLPDELFRNLDESAKLLAVPKNKLIEKALRIYLDQIRKAEYIMSYSEAAKDQEIMDIAEEGMTDYFNQLKE